jgi:predicted transglutaminase-like protease|tara:strand:+ start:223 stop:549 length:327 start_codon:yes stop_codon:yes gene_type:complete
MAINSDTDIVLAITQLGLNGNLYKLNQSIPPHQITSWDSNNKDSQPTDDELNTAYTAWKNANEYKKNREQSYPSIQEQLDMQYWDSVNGTTTWKDAIAKVKTDNPKPS